MEKLESPDWWSDNLTSVNQLKNRITNDCFYDDWGPELSRGKVVIIIESHWSKYYGGYQFRKVSIIREGNTLEEYTWKEWMSKIPHGNQWSIWYFPNSFISIKMVNGRTI